MLLKFNSTMNTDFNHSFINKTTVDIYIKPAMGREEDDTFQIPSVNFTWNITSF